LHVACIMSVIAKKSIIKTNHKISLIVAKIDNYLQPFMLIRPLSHWSFISNFYFKIKLSQFLFRMWTYSH